MKFFTQFEAAGRGQGHVYYPTLRIVGIEDSGNAVDWDQTPISRVIIDTGAHSIVTRNVRGRAEQLQERVAEDMGQALVCGMVNILHPDRVQSIQAGLVRTVEGKIRDLLADNLVEMLPNEVVRVLESFQAGHGGEAPARPAKAPQAAGKGK